MKPTHIIAALVAVILTLSVTIAYLVGREHGGRTSMDRTSRTPPAATGHRLGAGQAIRASAPEAASPTTPTNAPRMGADGPGAQRQAAGPVAGSTTAGAGGSDTAGRAVVVTGGAVLVNKSLGTRFASAPGTNNRVWIRGTSTVHDWEVESRTIGGHMEVGPQFPLDPGKARAGKVEADVSVFMPVRALKSVREGRPYSSAFDDVMYGRLNESDHKQINYRLTGLTLLEPTKEDAALKFESIGDLTVAGVTREIAMPVEMKVEEHTMRFTGQVAFKMSDFGIDPTVHVVAGGLIKTGDDLQVGMEWTVVRRE